MSTEIIEVPQGQLMGYDEAVEKLSRPTPPEAIFKLPKAGQEFDYVSLQYVMDTLDEVVGKKNWQFDYQLLTPLEGESFRQLGEIVVQGRLTINFKDVGPVYRENAGGQKVKLKRADKMPLDLGNDVKGAVADALKKCASMFGVARDVYGQNHDAMVAEAKQDAEQEDKVKLVQQLFIIARENNIEVDDMRKYIGEQFGLTSSKDMTIDQIEQVKEWLRG